MLRSVLMSALLTLLATPAMAHIGFAEGEAAVGSTFRATLVVGQPLVEEIRPSIGVGHVAHAGQPRSRGACRRLICDEIRIRVKYPVSGSNRRPAD